MGLGQFSAGFMMGFGTGFMTREIFPLAREMMTPILRVASKSGVRTFEFTREAMARIGERLEDIVAEVQSEMRHKRARPHAAKKAKRPRRRMAEVVPLRQRGTTA